MRPILSLHRHAHSIWNYREFVWSSIVNEYKGRFARSKFGVAWMVIQPLAMAAIYTTVLSDILGAKLAGTDSKYGYSMYLLAGILAWSLFADIVQRCTTVFIDNAGLLKKMAFPKITLPAISIGSALVANFALLVIVVATATILGFPIGPKVLLLIPLTILTALLASAIGVIAGVLNVFLRDIGQVVPILLQFWFWVTPIIYPLDAVPDYVKRLIRLNPVTPIVEGYQSLLLHNRLPTADILWVALLSFVLIVLGFSLFRVASKDMVDVL